MKYIFNIKNVYMYCYLLTIKDEKNIYEAIVESAPCKRETMLIWLEDFNFPICAIDEIKGEIEKYFALKGIDCIFESGKRVAG